ERLRRRARLRERQAHQAGRAARAEVAGAPRRQGLSPGVAARRRRPAVRGGRLAAAAILAVRSLPGDRQVRTLSDDARWNAVALAGTIRALIASPETHDGRRVRRTSTHLVAAASLQSSAVDRRL